MIAVVGVVTTVLGGCSFAMRGPDPNWDGKQKPDCAESYAPVMVDGITAGALGSAAVQVATDEKLVVPAEVTIAMLAVSLLYTASAASGAHKYNECRTATAIWRAREAIQERNEVAAASAATAPASLAPDGAAAQLRVPTGSPKYFCVRSPSRADLEICTRERIRCEHVRDALRLPRDKDCAPHDAAWCLGASGATRCFATRSACETHLAKARGGASECSERR